MKLKSLLVLLFSSVLLQVSAQISLQIKPVRPVYMLYDSIAIRTLVRNYSSHPLAFGSSKALQGEVRFHSSPQHLPLSTENAVTEMVFA